MTEWGCWKYSHTVPEYRTITGPNSPQLCLCHISLHFSFVPCLIFSTSHIYRVSSLINTRADSCLLLRLCLNAETAQALSQLLNHSSRVSSFKLCFELKQCLMINYSTVGRMTYIKRAQRTLCSRIIRLVIFNQFIDKIFALPFDTI